MAARFKIPNKLVLDPETETYTHVSANELYNTTLTSGDLVEVIGRDMRKQGIGIVLRICDMFGKDAKGSPFVEILFNNETKAIVYHKFVRRLPPRESVVLPKKKR